MMEPNLIASILLYLVATLFVGVLLFFFVRRFDKEPIRSRSPQVGVVGAVCINLVALFQVLRAAQAPIPCGFTDIIYQLLWSLGVATYFYRIVYLLHSYERHQRIADRARHMTPTPASEDESKDRTLKAMGDLVRNKYRTKSLYNQSPAKAMLYYALFKSVFVLLVVATASAGVAEQSWTKVSKDCTVWGTALSFIGDVFIAALCVYKIIKNRVQDPFLITTELKLTLYMSLCTMGPWGLIVVLGFSNTISENTVLFGKLYVVILNTFLSQLLILGFPLYHTYAGAHSDTVPRAKLTTLLLSKAHRKAFLEFLIKEWSSENLMFFEEASEWLGSLEKIDKKKDVSEEELLSIWETARKLYDTYIDPEGAEYQVNLPSTIVLPMTKFFRTKIRLRRSKKQSMLEMQDQKEVVVGTLHIQRFRELMVPAKKAIFRLMDRDSYERFMCTNEGKAIMFEIDRLKLERAASATNVMV